ncbi:MAG: hypothetical protein L3J34_11945 [Flavobacteriaceae bacterium]|nr:hypothetical protein [Flavobacteriaceae bacterium]
MKHFVILIISIFLFSCQENVKTSVDAFKTGMFKTALEDSETTSMAFRNDTIQIETYDNKKDTFNIKWPNNFEYILVKRNPKTLLDSTPFHVKITAIKKNTYSFKAYYKGSNFKQKGTATKIE